MNKIALFIPLALFLVLSVFLFKGLDRDPTELPSALVGEAFPEFFLPQLQNSQVMLSRDDIAGQVVLVNVWATWCFACRIEHPMLNDLAKQGVKIIGLNYKDQRLDAKQWLKERLRQLQSAEWLASYRPQKPRTARAAESSLAVDATTSYSTAS